MAGSRSRTGCGTCRALRQKCDETKPSCHNCVSKGVECGGYDLYLTEFSISEGFTGQMVCKLERGSPTSRLRKQRSDKATSRTRRSDKSLSKEQAPDSGPTVRQPKVPSTSGSIETDIGKRTDSTRAKSRSDETFLEPKYSKAGLDLHSMLLDMELFESSFDLLATSASGNGNDTSFKEVKDSSDSAQADSRIRTKLPTVQGIPDHIHHSVPMTPDPASEPNARSTGNQCLMVLDHTVSNSPLHTLCIPRGAVMALEAESLADCLAETLTTPSNSLVENNNPFDDYLSTHFLNILAPSFYPLTPERNPCRDIYGLLSTKSKPLKDAMRAASAIHLTNKGQLPAGVAQFYRAALRDSFRLALDSAAHADTLAATVLLSIISEIIDHDLGSWSSKLAGVNKLLTSVEPLALQDQSPSSCTMFLTLQYNWMVAIGRTMLTRERSLELLGHLHFIQDHANYQKHRLSQDYWFANLPDYEALILLKDITEIDEMMSSGSQSVTKTQQMIPQVASLLFKIQQWQPSPSSAAEPYAAFSSEVNEVWRQGMLCYVYQNICALPSWDARIQQIVRIGRNNIQKVFWMQTILWPAFILAGHAIHREDRTAFADSFENMHTEVDFKGPLAVLGILEKVWSELDNSESGHSKWREIIADSGLELNVLL